MPYKYRLISNSNIFRKTGCCKYAKKIAILLGSLGALWIFLLQMRLYQLSKYKSIVDSYKRQLNDELNNIGIIEESYDSWRTPDIDKSQILSAYLETRPEVVLEEDPNLIFEESAWAFVRIVGIIPVEQVSTQLTCYFRYKHQTHNTESYILKKSAISSSLVAFGENFDMDYSAAYINCPLPYPNEVYPQDIQLPGQVTVSINPLRSIDTLRDDEFVTIRYPNVGWDRDDPEKLFAVCVQPLHHNYDKTIDLIAFIEYYRMMGVDRFTFYRDDVTHKIDSILDYYSRLNVAVIIDWKLPSWYEFERNLRVDGIYAALNDCLYRSSSYAGYKYVFGVDIDEYILPRLHNNFSEMMNYLNPDYPTTKCTGAWIFRNVFYYLMYDDDPVTLSPEIPALNFHGKTRRWERVNPSHDRSKFIVQAKDVVELGNHRIWKLKRTWSILGSCKEVTVDPNIATSNHYRYCETEIDKCWQRKTIIDKSSHRFTKELGYRVEIAIQRIFGESTNG